MIDTHTTLRHAELSPCGVWRWRLTRIWSTTPALTIVMLNPSLADARRDDPTLRRCLGFAAREGFGGLVVVNLFGLRAAAPAALRRHADPVGPGNDAALSAALGDAAAMAQPVLCAWGTHPAARERSLALAPVFATSGARLVCLGLTATGAPRHPLYVRADEPFLPYPGPAAAAPHQRAFGVPQLGQSHSSGSASKGVPGRMPRSGSPKAGSYS
jgi:hypothetical protein